MTTREVINEDQIFLAFFNDGTVATARGIYDLDDYNNVKQAFVVPDNTPLYQVSNYFGFAEIPEKWKEIKN